MPARYPFTAGWTGGGGGRQGKKNGQCSSVSGGIRDLPRTAQDKIW